jgi:hypothetical protein
MKTTRFTTEDAIRVGGEVGVDWNKIDHDEFLRGMNLEVERRVVSGAPLATDDLLVGQSVLRHLEANPYYYIRLGEAEYSELNAAVNTSHYYGDRVRRLFFIASAVMLVGLPFFKREFSVPLVISIASILVLGFLAGLTNPRQVWVIWANIITSAVALTFFELFAVQSFADNAYFFVVNQLLAIMFLAALYFDTKTLRAMLLK